MRGQHRNAPADGPVARRPRRRLDRPPAGASRPAGAPRGGPVRFVYFVTARSEVAARRGLPNVWRGDISTAQRDWIQQAA